MFSKKKKIFKKSIFNVLKINFLYTKKNIVYVSDSHCKVNYGPSYNDCNPKPNQISGSHLYHSM